jgi:hypothetical protein
MNASPRWTRTNAPSEAMLVGVNVRSLSGRSLPPKLTHPVTKSIMENNTQLRENGE